ncbi:MAG TPA: hypothetical protein VMG81_08050 [Thermoplasmata archaeon]|nr:hypothetical protein [Thermoplasmata archaeon]
MRDGVAAFYDPYASALRRGHRVTARPPHLARTVLTVAVGLVLVAVLIAVA